jgi:hypothetical protein
MISSGGRFLQRPVARDDAALVLEVLGGGEGGGKEGEAGDGGIEVAGGGVEERIWLVLIVLYDLHYLHYGFSMVMQKMSNDD